MTLPIERTRAIQNVELFLLCLCRPELTPRIPKAIRRDARWLLKHYPNNFDLEMAHKKCPEHFGEPYSNTSFERLLKKLNE